MPNVIEVSGARKSFKTYETPRSGFLASLRKKRIVKYALRGVSFGVRQGEIAALLGKNGSGKSTLIKLLSGILHPDAGTVRVLGLDPWSERRKLTSRIGVVMGAHGQLWWDLPATDTFNLMRAIYKIPERQFRERLEFLTNILELKGVVKRQVRTLSLGEQMKCNFVASVLHMPELVILDEPTIGVDLPSKQALRTAIESMRDERKTTFLITTHIVEDLAMAEKIFVMDRGRIVYDGSRESLERYFGDRREVNIEFESAGDVKAYTRFGKVLELESNYIKLEVEQAQLRNRAFINLLSSENVVDYSVMERDLKPILLRLYAQHGGRRGHV
jgi:ABC-2 type transport system ATP-binding protein